MSTEQIILGIDLGTTYSAMAYVDRHGKPIIIQNAEGHSTTPSVIHFYDENACVVGDEAVKMVVVDANNIVRFIKRSMGEPDFELEFFGQHYRPQEVSALILKKLKSDAEEALGQKIQDAVITVPAYFNSAQRAATAEAGQLAGFNVLSIINEPTAAAIAYGIERLGEERRLMVFDLGGGTFDVTVMEIKGLALRTIATDGNAELGGKDWDDCLLNHVASAFIQRFGSDPRDDVQVYQELYERVLAAKIALSTKPKVVIPVNYRGNRLSVSVTQEEFEALTQGLVQQCIDTCQLVLERAHLQWSDIQEVLLAGGSTRMPMIRSMLRKLSGREPLTTMNPDECVAVGASLAAIFRHQPKHPALSAWRKGSRIRTDSRRLGTLPPRALQPSLSGEAPPLPPHLSKLRPAAPKDPNKADNERDLGLEAIPPPPPVVSATPQVPIIISDITSHALGVLVFDEAMRERVVPLIPQGTSLPAERKGRFAYAYDGMTAVKVTVTEGQGTTREEVTVVGSVVMERLAPRPKGTPIEVTYRYTINNILEVDVMDVESGKVERARMQLTGGLDPMDLEATRRKIAAASIT